MQLKVTRLTKRNQLTVDELWSSYLADGDKESYSGLILHYQPLLKRIAKKMSQTMPVDADEMESDGIFGLMDAIQKFDVTKGVKFEVYAMTRIRGSIIDAVRSRDRVPRSVRARESKVGQAVEMLSQRNGREPTVEELEDFTGLTHVEISECTIHQYQYQHNDIQYELTDFANPAPDSHVEIDAMREMIAESFSCLGQREQILFALYYNEDLSLSDIGVIFGITEARASQIHIRAIRDLYNKVRT